jgi:hypothetical protein
MLELIEIYQVFSILKRDSRLFVGISKGCTLRIDLVELYDPFPDR